MTKQLGKINIGTVVVHPDKKMDFEYQYKDLILKVLFDFAHTMPVAGIYLDDIDLMDLQAMGIVRLNKAFLGKVLLDGLDVYERLLKTQDRYKKEISL